MPQPLSIPGSDIKPWARPGPREYLFTNANVVDVQAGVILTNRSVITRQGKIASVLSCAPEEALLSELTVIDCNGLYLCPGLFDAHVHLCAVPGFDDLSKAFGNSDHASLLRQPYVAQQMLHRGLTSIRDCGGAQLPLKEVIDDLFPGPRLFICGHALSQYGGHGDLRPSHDQAECWGGLHRNNHLGRMCNGVPECMAAVREEVRCGADFIKIMGSGGVASPTDKLEHLQFTSAEIRAMVEYAENAGTFVTAHAYTTKAIRRCVENGVKGIEHGNFIDKPTAELMVQKGVYLTPTLITYAEMATERWKHYLPIESQKKNSEVLESGLAALRIACEAGVKMCYGSDLLGPLGSAQTKEFTIRSQVLSALEILQSATVNPARMMGWQNSIGQIKAGFQTDILILNRNPLDDVTVFDRPDEHILAVMKGGRVYKSRWDNLAEDGHITMRLS